MPPTTDPAGKVDQHFVIITGAASGLGRALAVRLAQDGWQIALADIDLPGCRETAALVEQAGGAARVEQLDVTDPQAWSDLVERLQREWDHLDLLVNNAGVACSGEIGDLPLANWHWAIDVNLFGVIHGCHACRDWLVRNPRGSHVVNIASAAAIVSAPTMAAYNVSKAGVVALSETLYAELRGRGVGVTVVCPGFFATNLLAGARFHTDAERDSAGRLMNGARLSAEVVARAIVRAISRKQLYLVLPARARIYWRLRRLWPTAMMKLVARIAGG
jgi:NAD(P)-dependent dehydrogenase (short-subunit alcohol dehydrogenase family)